MSLFPRITPPSAAPDPQTPADDTKNQNDTTDPRDPDSLPPLGEATDPDNWAAVNTFIDTYAQKATDFYNVPCDRADDNLKLLEEGTSGVVCEKDVISNKIRSELYTLVNALLQEPTTRNFEPEEMGEPQEVIEFISPDGTMQQFSIDDAVQAKFEQKLCDWYWDKAELESDIWAATLNCRTAGWTTIVFQWNRQEDLPQLETDISVRQILLDPSVGPMKAVEKANWAILHWRINYWQARAMFPQLSKLLDEKAKTTNAENDPVLRLGVNQQNQSTGEKMVDLTFFWLRNYPSQRMTPEEALAYGEVEQRAIGIAGGVPAGLQQDQDPNLSAVPQGAPADVLGTDGSQQPQALPSSGSGTNADPTDALEGESQPDNEDAADRGQDVSGDAAGTLYPQAQPATAFYLPNSDTPVTPADPEWPWWLAIRQITRVDRAIADDRATPFWDIPLAHMVANPVPLTACGQGDPQALQSMQEGRNRALTAAVEHADLHAHPVKVFCKSAWGELDARYKEEGASFAGMSVIVDDEIYKQLGGKINVLEQAPPISAALGEILTILGGELQDDTQGSQLLQGKQQGQITGWQAQGQLIQQANARFNLPAKFLEKMVRRIVKLLRWAVLWQARRERIGQICSEYPPEVVDALIERGRRNDCNVTIGVNVPGVQARKDADAAQKFQSRIISMKTTRERMKEDDRQETERLAAEQAQQPSQQKPPMEQINFKDLPPDGQSQLAAQAGIKLSPVDLAVHQQQQAQQDQQMKLQQQQAKGPPQGSGPPQGA